MAQIIKSSGEIIEVEPKNGKDFKLEEVKEIVDGWVELVYLPDGRYMLVNEEGRIHKLPVNLEASKLLYDLSDIVLGRFISGDVLVCEPKQFR